MGNINDLIHREGFWSTSRKSTILPFPIENEKAWKGKKAFLEKLKALESKAGQRRYKGWSTCRLCGKHNGSTDYRAQGWVWPEGFKHYVEDHNVRPSLAFQEMVMGARVGEDD